MRRTWQRFRRWLHHRVTSRDWEHDKMVFDRAHAAQLDEAARIERQQRQVVQRLRALGLEVEIYRHTANRDEQ